MVVVRVIAQPHVEDSAELRQQTTNAPVEVANQPGLGALLFDFDVTQSQRPFYAAVLGSFAATDASRHAAIDHKASQLVR